MSQHCTKSLTAYVLQHGFAGSAFLLILLCILFLKCVFVCNFQNDLGAIYSSSIIRRHLHLGLLSFHELYGPFPILLIGLVCVTLALCLLKLEAQRCWRMESIYIVKVKIDKVTDEIGRHHTIYHPNE